LHHPLWVQETRKLTPEILLWASYAFDTYDIITSNNHGQEAIFISTWQMRKLKHN
jgi:hypothetical protein